MIAVYGGALSPITLAHEKIIKDLSKAFNVVVMPVGDKYEKIDLLPAKDRLNMISLLNLNNNVSISTIEIDNPKILHTYETLTLLKHQYPTEEIRFVTGSDNLIGFDKWGNAENILKEFGLIVINRDEFNPVDIINNNKLLLNYIHNIEIVKLNIIKGISSTNLRETIKKENYDIDELRKYVDDKVLSYILKNKLFK